MSISHPSAERIGFQGIQLFEPDPAAVYSLEAAARLARVPRHTILVYCRHGLVSPVEDPAANGYYFDVKGIRVLRRIEALRAKCGDDLAGMRMILELLDEVQRLESELRRLRIAAGATTIDGDPAPRLASAA